MNSFNVKRLRLTFILAGTNQVFPGTNSNQLVIENLRMSCKVQAVARLATQADIRVFGMLQADMNALTVAWANPPVVLDHIVILEADNGNGAFVQVFKGTIIEAQPDYRSMPNVPFCLLAVTGYFQKINPAAPTSYPETVDIGVAAGDIIDRMGPPWTYVDGGADGVLSNPYFFGTLWDQLAQACQAANADFYVQGDEILIVPAGQPRDKAPAVVLGPDSGLVGYPMFERSGLNVTALFDPAFLCGTAIEVKTALPPQAAGRWYPYALLHDLDTTDKSRWFTSMQCLRVIV